MPRAQYSCQEHNECPASLPPRTIHNSTCRSPRRHSLHPDSVPPHGGRTIGFATRSTYSDCQCATVVLLDARVPAKPSSRPVHPVPRSAGLLLVAEPFDEKRPEPDQTISLRNAAWSHISSATRAGAVPPPTETCAACQHWRPALVV